MVVTTHYRGSALSKFTPTSFRLPTETLEAMRSLAMSGESLSGVLTRAVAALQGQPRPPEPLSTQALLDRLVSVESAVESLNSRLIEHDVLISRISALPATTNVIEATTEKIPDALPVVQQSMLVVDNQLLETTLEETATTEGVQYSGTNKMATKRTKYRYSEATKQKAIDALRKNPNISGKALDAIIVKHCGHGLGDSNVLRVVRRWEKSMGEV
ncbi:hypothetical protein CCP4SC76_2490006 [Gammaproteobacteria bacterium]